MRNPYLSQQCYTMLSSITIIRHGVRSACMRDDGQIDKYEQKVLSKIEKDLAALERTLQEVVK
jgi:hypothetical protein